MSRWGKVAPGARIHDADTAASLGLRALFLFDEDSGQIRDLVSGTNAPLTSGGVARRERGRILTFNGSQQVNMLRYFPTTVGASNFRGHAANFSVLGRIRPDAAAASDPAGIFGIYASGDQSGFGIGWNTSTQVGLQWLSGNGAGSLSRSNGTTGVWYDVYAHVDRLTAGFAWINGQPATTSQGATLDGGSGSQNNEISVGAQHRSAGFLRNANGAIEWGAVLFGPSLNDTSAFNLYQSDFPYSLLTPRRRYYLVPAAGGDTALAGAATGSGVAAGGLTTDIRLAGVPTGAGAAVAALTTGIPLAGTPTGAGVTVGALTTEIRLAGAPTGVGTAAGALTTGIAMAVSPAGSGVAAAALTTAIRVVASPTGSGIAAGAVTTAIQLSAALTGTGAAVADLTTTPAGIAGSATGTGAAVGALTTGIRFVAAPTGAGAATGALTTDIRLAGSPAGSGVASAALTVDAVYSVALTGAGVASGALSTGIRLSGAVAGSGVVAADLTAGIPPVADPLRTVALPSLRSLVLPPPAPALLTPVWSLVLPPPAPARLPQPRTLTA